MFIQLLNNNIVNIQKSFIQVLRPLKSRILIEKDMYVVIEEVLRKQLSILPTFYFWPQMHYIITALAEKVKHNTREVYNCHFINKVKLKILYSIKIFIQDCVSGHKCKSYNVLLFVNDITVCDLQDIIVRSS